MIQRKNLPSSQENRQEREAVRPAQEESRSQFSRVEFPQCTQSVLSSQLSLNHSVQCSSELNQLGVSTASAMVSSS